MTAFRWIRRDAIPEAKKPVRNCVKGIKGLAGTLNTGGGSLNWKDEDECKTCC